MKETTRDVRAALTVFTDEETGRQVGAMYRLETGAGPRWVGEVHDYDGEFPDGPYDPITLGAFADGEQARTEIRDRVQAARGDGDPSDADANRTTLTGDAEA